MMTEHIRFVPFADEASMAQLAFDRWQRAEAENMAEYIYRRRTLNLASLLSQAIEEELNAYQRRIIRMRYFENRSPFEIAQQLGVEPCTVRSALKRAEKTLCHALKYAVAYRDGQRSDSVLPLAVREAMAVNAARNRETHTLSDRLRALREGEHLTEAATADGAQISPVRYASFESGQAVPDARELLLLSAFFGVSTDSLLKGGAA